jgi:hypothetical protein
MSDTFTATIARLRHLAGNADSTMVEAIPPPDAALLDLCSDVLDAVKAERDIETAFRKYCDADHGQKWSQAKRDGSKYLLKEWDTLRLRAKTAARRASKVKATTPAGIYAKALIVATSKTGSPVLAMSLAQDLIASPTLRASLWPANPAGEAAQ